MRAVNEIKRKVQECMGKTLGAPGHASAKIRTGRAYPSIPDSVMVSYYGADTPLRQAANVTVEDSRTLALVAFDKSVIQAVEKVVMTSDLGLDPTTAGTTVRVPMPALIEETRKGYTKQVRARAEQARVSVHNIRRDALAQLRGLQGEKEIGKDEERHANDGVQKLTDKFIGEIEKALKAKEADLMTVQDWADVMEKTWKDVCVPRRVAIIMDGNNRWAKKRLLPGIAGHKVGVDAVRAVIEVCAEAGVEALTLFAFSGENWQCPADEVSALMEPFLATLRREVRKFDENGIRLRIIDDHTRLHSELQVAMREAEAATAGNTRFLLQAAANYGGQWDIVQAAQRLAREIQGGHLAADDVSTELFQGCLITGDQPLSDPCIRTGGEHRISSFLLWQLAYVELYFLDLFWPDFKRVATWAALMDFSKRQRRFGKTSKQAEAKACPSC